MNINGQTVRKWLCYGVFYSVVHVLDSNVTVLLGWMPVNHVWKLPLPIGPPTVMEKCEPLWTISISSSPFTKRFACKNRIANTQKKRLQLLHDFHSSTTRTFRCSGDCACEQKYKWHRLLAYDPNNDCSGVFMDWFLFPSCCSCRCLKNPFQQ